MSAEGQKLVDFIEHNFEQYHTRSRLLPDLNNQSKGKQALDCMKEGIRLLKEEFDVTRKTKV